MCAAPPHWGTLQYSQGLESFFKRFMKDIVAAGQHVWPTHAT